MAVVLEHPEIQYIDAVDAIQPDAQPAIEIRYPPFEYNKRRQKIKDCAGRFRDWCAEVGRYLHTYASERVYVYMLARSLTNTYRRMGYYGTGRLMWDTLYIRFCFASQSALNHRRTPISFSYVAHLNIFHTYIRIAMIYVS